LHDPVTHDHGRYDTPGMVTSIGMRKDGGYIVGLERSVALWSPNGVFTPLATPEPDLTDKQIFLAGYEAGLPDGSCVDAHDHLWNCRVVGGAEVLCLDTDGTPLRKVTTPCTWPTSCVFGGPDLDTLFVASARFTMSDAHLAAAPWEGNLFSCTLPDVTGRLHHKFG